MLVGRADFERVVTELSKEMRLSLDFETTGLRMFHGDRFFSFIIANAKIPYYFNFLPYADLGSEYVLTRYHWEKMEALFKDPTKTWYIQRAANFDLCIASVDGFFIEGRIHCTQAIGRVEYNDHMSFSLEDQLARIGRVKTDEVKKYIMEHKLYTDVKVPGKAKVERRLHYDRVPFKLMLPYGENDGLETFHLGEWQEKSITNQDVDSRPGRTLRNVLINERRLQKTIHRMKHQGVLIDRKYCEEAARFEQGRMRRAHEQFRKETGIPYKDSGKLFAEVFKSDKERWEYTDKNNPSFESTVLKRFEHPGARAVLDAREAKSNSDFYQGFLYHADSQGRVHPNYNPEGATHGRFSSSEPNFQNLTSDEDEVELEFMVRKAIIPSPGFLLIMPDFDQMEYRFMLEMACRLKGEKTKLVELVLGGLDVHEATAQVANQAGFKITRYQAKTTNFLTLYGGGNKKLADGLGCSIEQAKAIRRAIFQSSPEIQAYIHHIMRTAEQRGYITNWFGRRCHFSNRAYAYRAPNYHTSGGCADIVKIAMNGIDEFLLDKKSRMIMTVHDELPIEVHESEIDTVPHVVKGIMENAFESQYLPLTVGMKWSNKSLGDKVKGFPA